MNILITGCNGFIGSEVAELLSENHEVYGVSRSINHPTKYKQYSIDILETNQLSNLMSEKSIDMVVHCAGKAIVSDCDKNPYQSIMVNGMGTASVLEASRVSNVKRVISIETDKVYGYQKTVPTNEYAQPNPNSPYEFSKVVAANMNEFYSKQYGMDIIAVRPVNVFGANDPNFRIIPNTFRSISEGRAIKIYSDAVNTKRDYIYVKDVARMIEILIDNRPKYTAYNFSADCNFTVSELVERIKKVLTYNKPNLIIDKGGDFKEIPLQVIDGSRFVEEFDFKFTHFDTAIRDSYNEYKWG